MESITREHGLRTVVTDVLVIGGGAAGTRAAVSAASAGARTLMILKGEIGQSGSTCFPARGPHGSAYQAADGCSHADGDSPDVHYQDILTAGLGMVDPQLARILADEAAERLRDLISWGFVPDPEPPSGRDRPHWAGYSCFASKPRAHGIWDVSAGHAGALVVAAANQIERLGVYVMPHMSITDLLVQDDVCIGALGVDLEGSPLVFRAGAVILGAGGAGQLFPAATASHEATGDGYALALRAGAELVNMEFMQFMVRPLPGGGPLLWMLCPEVRNAAGEPVLERYLPAGVAPEEAFEARTLHYPFSSRDASGWLDIALRSEALAGRGEGPRGVLTLDYDNPRSRVRARLELRARPQHHWPGPETGPVDLPDRPAKVAHAAHAINGGIFISPHGESNLPGLYAAGETAAGAHGADRLGGNMLPNCQVFGHRAGGHAARRSLGNGPEDLRRETLDAPLTRLEQLLGRQGELRAKDLKMQLQQLTARSLYVVRSAAGLAELLAGIEQLRVEGLDNVNTVERRGLWHALEVENMLLVAESMAHAALLRQESRGSHFREDYPERNDAAWRKAIFQHSRDGVLHLRTAELDRTPDESSVGLT